MRNENCMGGWFFSHDSVIPSVFGWLYCSHVACCTRAAFTDVYSRIIHFCIYIHIYMFRRCYCPRQLANEECSDISGSYYGEWLQDCFEKHKSMFDFESDSVYSKYSQSNFLWYMWIKPEYFVYEKL